LRAKIFSSLYRLTRYVITNILYFFQKLFFLPTNLEPAVRFGDRMLGSFYFFKKIIFDFPLPKNSNVHIFDLEFPSPIIGSSFKSDKKILEMWLRMGIGGIIFKTIMSEKRLGNSKPRLQDIKINNEKGLFNSLGLPGPGLDEFIHNLNNSELWSFNRPIGISIGGESENEYLNNIKTINTTLDDKFKSYFFELNISCPNTETGQVICENPEQLDSLLKKIRIFISKPISVKISPDVNDNILADIGQLCSEYDSIIINAGNTHYKSREELGFDEKSFSMQGGGVSGPSIFYRTLSMVEIFSKFNSPIMATGGISNIEHINTLKNAGASLFGMATNLVLDPYCIPILNEKV